MLNNGFRDTNMVFRLSQGFCNKFTLNLGFRDNFTLQEEQPDIFIVNLTLCLASHTQIDLISLCDRLGYCFTPYQRLRLYNGAPFSRLLRHAGDTEDVFSA